MLILNTKHCVENPNNLLAKDGIYLALKLLGYIVEDLADNLIEKEALQILNATATVVPEANQMKDLILQFSKKRGQPGGNKEEAVPQKKSWFFCPFL